MKNLCPERENNDFMFRTKTFTDTILWSIYSPINPAPKALANQLRSRHSDWRHFGLDAVVSSNSNKTNKHKWTTWPPTLSWRRGAAPLMVVQLLVLGRSGGEDGGHRQQDGGSVRVSHLVDHDGGHGHAEQLEERRSRCHCRTASWKPLPLSVLE